ncbi:hypothetical protein NPIL_135791 [Nephila pilipes]|uniref:Uncharacterized protein n=1 Tax=Nephila pilipes TaxID=299642 RepID=A0A8X6Q9G1_NEPPI|nr:hypothetical protein NPIL_135791 [Nephila pilipes]
MSVPPPCDGGTGTDNRPAPLFGTKPTLQKSCSGRGKTSLEKSQDMLFSKKDFSSRTYPPNYLKRYLSPTAVLSVHFLLLGVKRSFYHYFVIDTRPSCRGRRRTIKTGIIFRPTHYFQMRSIHLSGINIRIETKSFHLSEDRGSKKHSPRKRHSGTPSGISELAEPIWQKGRRWSDGSRERK